MTPSMMNSPGRRQLGVQTEKKVQVTLPSCEATFAVETIIDTLPIAHLNICHMGASIALTACKNPLTMGPMALAVYMNVNIGHDDGCNFQKNQILHVRGICKTSSPTPRFCTSYRSRTTKDVH